MDGGIFDFHAAQDHFHGHIGKGLAASVARKHEFARLDLRQIAKDGDGARRQGLAVFATGFHPAGGHRPDFLVEVDFSPAHSK